MGRQPAEHSWNRLWQAVKGNEMMYTTAETNNVQETLPGAALQRQAGFSLQFPEQNTRKQSMLKVGISIQQSSDKLCIRRRVLADLRIGAGEHLGITLQ